ncbi:MAG: DUF1549 and DUF1553 domain-containing protein [Planctomycetales bacterium]
MSRRPSNCSLRILQTWGQVAALIVLLAVVSVALYAAVPEAAQKKAPSLEERHWAYRPVVRPAVPGVAATKYGNPIDLFLAAQLQKQDLHFSPPASRRELIRRLSFDLIGLPPSVEEVQTFVNDQSPDAYEKVVDRLLADPGYGERWGRMWLDGVRYADTAGFNADPLRPLAWKYRDYVIESFNRDTPYNQFLGEQLAGDELYPDQERAWRGLGFCRLGPDESNASDVLLARQENLNDLVSVLGSVVLGQSIGCAQCHDHKFDALTQRDFYSLQAYFAALIPVDSVPVGNAAQLADYQQQVEQWSRTARAAFLELYTLESQAYVKAYGWKRLRFPELLWKAFETFPEDRTAFQKQITFFSDRQIHNEVGEKGLAKTLTPEQQTRRAQLQEIVKYLKEQKPKPAQQVEAMTVCEGREMPKTFFLANGSYARPKDELNPTVPVVMNTEFGATPPVISSPRPGCSGRRSALVGWLTDRRNPLTARVWVNRLWQTHFGKGLVSNANDFGVQTPPPSHPELLDWLAVEAQEPTVEVQGCAKVPWGVKRLQKLIVMSVAYRQSSLQSGNETQVADVLKKDPDNTWYSRFPRQRLTGEQLRDALLTVSGELNRKTLGPPVYPPLPEVFGKRDSWPVSKEIADQRRRPIYILCKRNLPYPFLGTMDFPDMHESCPRRQNTTTGLQALQALNSEITLHAAQAFAGQILAGQASPDAPALVNQAYERALGRPVSKDEQSLALAFLDRQSKLYREKSATEKGLAPLNASKELDAPWGAAWTDFCHALLSSNEFLYID